MSLVEALVAIAVLSMISVSVLGLVITTLHLDKLARDRSVATSLARGRVEMITAQDFEVAADYADYQLPEETATTTPPTLTSDYGTIPDYPDFKRVVVLRYDTPVTGMLTVEATVSWQHLNSGEKTHEMITYLHPQLE